MIALTADPRGPTPGPLLRWLASLLPGGNGGGRDLAERLAALEQGQLFEQRERQRMADELAAARTTQATTDQLVKTLRDDLDQSREHGRNQARTITLLERTIQSLQEGASSATAQLVGQTAMIDELRSVVDRLEQDRAADRATISALKEQLAAMPTLKQQQQQMIMETHIWRQYSFSLRGQLGDQAPPLPDIPLIKLENL